MEESLVDFETEEPLVDLEIEKQSVPLASITPEECTVGSPPMSYTPKGLEQIQSTYRSLCGRDLSPSELASLQRVRDALNIDFNDGFFTVFIAFEYYKGLYQELPDKIRANVSPLLFEAGHTIQETARLEVERLAAQAVLLKQEVRQDFRESLDEHVRSAFAKMDQEISAASQAIQSTLQQQEKAIQQSMHNIAKQNGMPLWQKCGLFALMCLISGLSASFLTTHYFQREFLEKERALLKAWPNLDESTKQKILEAIKKNS